MSLPHVLLGLLHAEPKTGYELTRTMESDLAAVWSAGFSQIYPALARLRRIGWVRLKTLGPRRGPPRLLYRVTAAGRRELARWLSAPPSSERRHDPLLARIAFLDVLPAAERRRVLAAIDAGIATETEGWTSSPAAEGSIALARRAAVEEREALRRFLLRTAAKETREPREPRESREIRDATPETRPSPRPPRRVAPGRRRRPSARRRS